MRVVPAGEARELLDVLLNDSVAPHKPFKVAGKRRSAVLVSEADWRAIQETLYLLSIPRMRESIRAGMKMSVRKCRRASGY